MPSENFLFVDLSQGEADKPFDGLAAGTFRDMWGTKITITRADLSKFLSNTQEVIDSTKSESGEIVGLPIDMQDHDHRGGAGWITGVELEGDRLRFVPKWTDDGREAIAKNKCRFFSASLNPDEMVVLGGSLTNWPASRDKKGRMALRPVELSESMFENGQDLPEETLSKKEREPMGDETKVPTLAELAASPEGQQMVAELAEKRAAELIKAEQRKAHVADFSARAISGTDARPRGLPVKQEELAEFMASLDASQQEKAEALISAILDKGLIEFEAKGHGKEVETKEPLPAEYAARLDDGSMKIADLSSPVLMLGDLSKYDLTKWVKED